MVAFIIITIIFTVPTTCNRLSIEMVAFMFYFSVDYVLYTQFDFFAHIWCIGLLVPSNVHLGI